MFWCILFVCVFIVGVNTDVTATTEPANVSTIITASTTSKTAVNTNTSVNLTTKNPTVTLTTTTSTSSQAQRLTSEQTFLQTQTPTSKQTNQSIRIIEEFKGISHGVSSGKIMVIGNNTFQIPNFHFDGLAPRAFFIVGKGDTVSEKGTVVHLEGSESPLPAYDGESVKLTLPAGLTVSDIDWLAVWCFAVSQNLGYVFVNKEVFPNTPQTFHLDDHVTSGPILLVNKKTLYIPNFHYNGGYKNVHFWVGNGSEPSSDGRMIPDEKGSLEDLHTYQGQNLNINLPDDINTDNIEYFGVWSVDQGVSLGHVPINIVTDVPEAPIFKPFSTSIHFTPMRLPKCCPIDSVLTINGCKEKPFAPPFEPTFKIYEHNDTHFSNESMDLQTIKFSAYHYAPKCESGRYALDEENDEFAILQNTSLLVKGAAIAGVLSTDMFCLDNIENNETLLMKILVCIPEYKIQKAMFITYVAFTIISTFCFAITFFLYFFWLKVEDVHRKCFTGYVFAMTITFLALTIVQTASVEDSGCEVLGFLFQISMIASFTLLGILCADIFIIIKYIDEKKYLRTRQRWYLGVAVGVPTFFMIISLARNLIPDVPNSFFKPQYMRNNCYFEAESQRTIIFYVPICLSMVVSAVFLVWTKIIIVQNDRDRINDYFWIEKGTVYKFMWRKHLIIFLTSLMWSLETIIRIFFADSNMLLAIDIVEASQGILVLLLFVVNKDTRTQIVKIIKARRRRKKPLNHIGDEDFIHLEDFNLS